MARAHGTAAGRRARRAITAWGGAERARFVAKYEDSRGYRNKVENGNAGRIPTESWLKKLGLNDGYKAVLTYDDQGRFDSIRPVECLRVIIKTSPTAPGRTRGNFDSAFDSAGRRNALWRAGSVAFDGDNQHYFSYVDTDDVGGIDRNQVTEEWNDQDSTRQMVYDYDLMGNRNFQREVAYGTTYYTDDATNKYTSITGLRPESTLTHDLDGNLTQDGTWTYTWDAENRLKSMTKTGQTLTFTYDYLGRRIRKVVTGTDAKDRKYVWNGWELVAETVSDGYSIQYSFVHGPDFSNGCGGNAGGAGGLLAVYSPGAVINYAVPDAMGNVVGYLDASGNVNAAFEYNAYGQIRAQTGTMTSLPVGFASQYTDRETGLVYYGYRYYNATHGRFINRDPIEEEGGLNLYGFVENDPVNRWDVLGLDCALTLRTDWSFDFETGAITFNSGFQITCNYEVPPQPSLSGGSFNRPSFGNPGWDRNPWGFDPRAANTASYASGDFGADAGGLDGYDFSDMDGLADPMVRIDVDLDISAEPLKKGLSRGRYNPGPGSPWRHPPGFTLRIEPLPGVYHGAVLDCAFRSQGIPHMVCCRNNAARATSCIYQCTGDPGYFPPPKNPCAME